MWWGIAAIAASVIGAAVNYFSQKSANEAQADMMREQNEFNAAQVDKQNEYNSPANQVERLKNAGLNPAFFFGNNGIDNVQSNAATGAALPNIVAPQVDGDSVARSLFDKQRIKNETIKTEQDVRESIEKSKSYQIANSQAQERFINEQNKIKADTSLSDSERQLKLQQLETEKLRKDEVFYNAENLKYNLNLLEQRAVTERWSQRKLAVEIDRITKLTPFEASNLASSSNLSNAQAKLAAESLNKIQAEVTNLVKQGAQIDAVTLGQIIENEVANVKADNEISAELLKGNSDVINVIWSNTGGIVGDLVKTISGLAVGNYKNDSQWKHKDRVYGNRQSSHSWLFSN